MFEFLAQVDPAEAATKLGDGVILGKLVWAGIGFAAGLLAGWLGLKRPSWISTDN